MATERVTTRDDGATTERIVERDGGGTTYVDRGGSGVGGVIIGIAVLALVAIVAFFLLNANRNDALRTNAVTSAASTVADSTAGAAQSAATAPNTPATAVTPNTSPRGSGSETASAVAGGGLIRPRCAGPARCAPPTGGRCRRRPA